MKTLRFFWAAMFVVCWGVCFTACSDDDDNTIGNGNNGGTIKTENSVTLQTAGTLSLVLGDKVQYITSLKIKGPLNGDDIICLRQMLRCTYEDADKRGMLTVLDISDASIVSGGDKYYSDYGSCSTSNNKIGDGMFSSCESLTQIALPESVTEMGHGAFEYCRNLTQVIIGNSVTEIGNRAFEDCSGLTQISIPNSVTEIGAWAFYGCSGLTSITIPNSVIEISNYAFIDCKKLTQLTIGNGVTTIGSQAFQNCTGLESITSLNPEPPRCSSYTFYAVPTNTCVLYVPKGSKETYSTASQWKNFTNIEEI